MPKLNSRLPKYRLHRPSRRAVVTLGGVDHYLGTFGTAASKAAYNSKVSEWLGGHKLSPVVPLVPCATEGKHARSDCVGSNLWGALIRHAHHGFVKHISFKGMRKATAQQIRDQWGKEVSRTFLADADEDVQDENYTRLRGESRGGASRDPRRDQEIGEDRSHGMG